MPYTFVLTVKKDNSLLALEQDGQSIAATTWPEQHDMGRQLFQAIAELLQKNDLTPEQIEIFVIDAYIPEHTTSLRIAETVRRVYTFGVKVKMNNFTS